MAYIGMAYIVMACILMVYIVMAYSREDEDEADGVELHLTHRGNCHARRYPHLYFYTTITHGNTCHYTLAGLYMSVGNESVLLRRFSCTHTAHARTHTHMY